MYTLNSPLTSVKGIGPKLAAELEKHNLHTVKDIVLQLPLRYEDRSKLVTISDIPEDELITFQATITSASQFYKNRKTIQSARAKDATGSIKLMWFNNKFILSRIKEGGEFLVSGKKNKTNTMIQPVVEALKAETLHTGRLVPIYSSTISIKQGSLRHIIKEIVDNLVVPADELDSALGSQSTTLLNLADTIKELHFPTVDTNIEAARYRLVLEEFLILMKTSEYLKSQWSARADAKNIMVRKTTSNDKAEYSWLPDSIPFQLTQAQLHVTKEILDDLQKNVPMNRIVIGDVGSGKTVVAGIAAQQMSLSGYSTALIAPTKILAEQHTATIQKLFPEVEVELITAGQKSKKSTPASAETTTATKPKLYIGTHAVLNRLQLIKPALIVYDEQHRFGVRHRSLAQELGFSPHILTMTATPIPRSMMLTLFSHLQLSAIDQLPPGRVPSKTWLVSERKRESSYQWIKEQFVQFPDQQVIIVCPFIDPSDSKALENVAAASEMYKTIANTFSAYNVELLHGKIQKKTQEEIIQRLFAKEIQVLVTTPVVEVGVDLPQANIIVIEAAERFGLASLHQLRGRVGRAGQESYCLLFTNSRSPEAKERLKMFCKEDNGLRLAELDLQRRGAGDIFGTIQSGFTGLRYGSWSNLEMITTAQAIYPQLKKSWQPTLVSMPELSDEIPFAN